MSTAYSLVESYQNDYELADFVENVTWERATVDGTVTVTGLKGRWENFDTPESQSVAAGIQLTNDAAAVVVWQPVTTEGNPPNTPFAPAEGHILRRADQSNEGWLIINSVESRFGHWICACEKEVVNA